MTGSDAWPISWHAAHSAETSSGPEVLHLVDEDRDTLADVGGQATDVAEQLDQVDLDVAGVGATADGGCVDARVPAVAQLRVRAGVALGERLDDAEHVGDVVGLRMAELADGGVQRRAERSAQGLVGPGLELAGAPAGSHRGRAQGVEQHRLADAAEPGEDQGPFRPSFGDPFEHDLEGAAAVRRGRPARADAGRLRGRRGCESGPCSQRMGLSSGFRIFPDTRRSCRAGSVAGSGAHGPADRGGDEHAAGADRGGLGDREVGEAELPAGPAGHHADGGGREHGVRQP